MSDNLKERFAEVWKETYAAGPWHLKSRNLIMSKMGNAAPASQIVAMLQNNGVSPDEIEWTGLHDLWQQHGNSPISKERALQAIEQGVNVGEVLHGGTPTRNDLYDQWQEYHMSLHQKYGDGIRLKATPEELDKLDDLNARAESAPTKRSTKYHQYQLPGGENYREMLLTHIPPVRESDPAKVAPIRQKLDELNRQWMLVDDEGKRSIEQQREQLENQIDEMGRPPDSFHSPHWDEPNVLAHIRFNDRTGADGKKHLHIEEIQSDWHQKGRKQGYGPQYTSMHNIFYTTPSGERVVVGSGDTEEEARQSVDPGWHAMHANGQVALQSERHDMESAEGVPDAPFKKNWHMLAMKRMIHHAAANGYDRVSWTPGEEQAKRYDLSKHVSRIEYGKGNGAISIYGNDNQTILDGSVKDGKIHAASEFHHFHGKPLEDVVGKDIAEKLVNGQHDNQGYVRLHGEGLKVGGEGMKGFYDNLLVNDTNKLIKRHGARVQTHTIHAPKEVDFGGSLGKMPLEKTQHAHHVHGFDITPSMKHAALNEGHSMFRHDSLVERFAEAQKSLFPDPAPEPRAPVSESEATTAAKRVKAFVAAHPERPNNPLVRMEFEHGTVWTGLAELHVGHRYGEQIKKFGQLQSIEPIRPDEKHLADSPFIMVQYKPSHPRHQRYANRMDLKDQLPHHLKHLITHAKRQPKDRFLEEHAQHEPHVMAATGLRLHDFWKSVHEGSVTPKDTSLPLFDSPAHSEPAKPGIEGMQRGLFDEEASGQKKLFDFMPPTASPKSALPEAPRLFDDIKPIKQKPSLPGQQDLFHDNLAERFAAIWDQSDFDNIRYAALGSVDRYVPLTQIERFGFKTSNLTPGAGLRVTGNAHAHQPKVGSDVHFVGHAGPGLSIVKHQGVSHLMHNKHLGIQKREIAMMTGRKEAPHVSQMTKQQWMDDPNKVYVRRKNDPSKAFVLHGNRLYEMGKEQFNPEGPVKFPQNESQVDEAIWQKHARMKPRHEFLHNAWSAVIGQTDDGNPAIAHQGVTYPLADHEHENGQVTATPYEILGRIHNELTGAPVSQPAGAPVSLPLAGFQTSMGSQYNIGDGGVTTRTKAKRPFHNDSGQKQASHQTFYVDPLHARILGMHQGLNAEKTLITHQGVAYPLHRAAGGQWGMGPLEKQNPITLHTEPKVGLAPLELWHGSDHPAGGTQWQTWHPGSPIVSLQHKLAAPAQNAPQAQPKPQKAPKQEKQLPVPLPPAGSPIHPGRQRAQQAMGAPVQSQPQESRASIRKKLAELEAMRSQLDHHGQRSLDNAKADLENQLADMESGQSQFVPLGDIPSQLDRVDNQLVLPTFKATTHSKPGGRAPMAVQPMVFNDPQENMRARAAVAQGSAPSEKSAPSAPQPASVPVAMAPQHEVPEIVHHIAQQQDRSQGFHAPRAAVIHSTVSDKTYPAVYRVVEAEHLFPSHHYNEGIVKSNAPHGYPEELQPREYLHGNDNDQKVRKFADQKRPHLYISTHSDPLAGPPIVGHNNTVIAGNGRAMSLQLAYHRQDADWYRRQLEEDASHYGINPETLRSMHKPVLVRETQLDPRSQEALDLGKESNIESTQDEDVESRAANLQHLLNDDFIKHVDVPEDSTLADVLSGGPGRPIIDAIYDSLPEQKRPAYFLKNTRTLNDQGKDLVTAMLLSKFMPKKTLQAMGGQRSLKAAIESSIPQLLSMNAMGQFGSHIEGAARFLALNPHIESLAHLQDELAQGKITDEFNVHLRPETKMITRHLVNNKKGGRYHAGNIKKGLQQLITDLRSRGGLYPDEDTPEVQAAKALGLPPSDDYASAFHTRFSESLPERFSAIWEEYAAA